MAGWNDKLEHTQVYLLKAMGVPGLKIKPVGQDAKPYDNNMSMYAKHVKIHEVNCMHGNMHIYLAENPQNFNNVLKEIDLAKSD